MAVILFDNHLCNHLFPFTHTRAVAALRAGMVTMQERWAYWRKEAVAVHTRSYLQCQYPVPEGNDHIWIDAAIVPAENLLDLLAGLSPGTCWADETGLIAGRLNIPFHEFNASQPLQHFQTIHDHVPVGRLSYPWQIMQWNDQLLRQDFKWITRDRASQPISPTNHLVQQADIFVEEGVVMEYCTLNASTGPIYIGKNAVLMEGSAIRGPFALGEAGIIKMNSRIYGATSLGPCCMCGGEIKNTVMMGYSNKAHDGYLGDSVIGEWCNFGAGTSNSNIKNTAGLVSVWDEAAAGFVEAGRKCGVMMGDYSRTAINSAINTGSVIGVCCNVFGTGLLPRVIGHFSWGVAGEQYRFEKAIQDIENWKTLKLQSLSAAETSILKTIFDENH